jgi:beta-phosphoglucomutase-like phosphatase (HAD superfamily)
VTSTHRRLTEVALDTIGRQYFAATVCGDEVGHPKPHPEPYLTAAAQLGVVPELCVAIEDSLLGIVAAENAGCVVVAVPSEVEIEPAPTRTIRPSLVGMTVDDLAALVAGERMG